MRTKKIMAAYQEPKLNAEEIREYCIDCIYFKDGKRGKCFYQLYHHLGINYNRPHNILKFTGTCDKHLDQTRYFKGISI